MTLEPAEQLENPQIAHLKILVVDDDEMNRRLMRLLLVRDGHDVQVVANGVEALDAVKEQRFDIVFMDLQMPLMDGFEASRHIRKWENGNAHTYIVALTASYLPDQGHLLFNAGIDNYISKPFEVRHIQQLLHVIARSGHSKPELAPFDIDKQPAVNVVLDVQKGILRIGGDPQSYKDFLKDFIQSLPGRINSLERRIEERDLQSLEMEAHNLKGVSSNLGALELSECADKLDKQSREGYTDQDQALILELKGAAIHLQKTATDFLNDIGNAVASA